MEKEIHLPRTALVACSRLVDFAGAEITTLEIASALKGLGIKVAVAALEIGMPIRAEIEALEIDSFDLSKTSMAGRKFDVLWVSHHAVAYRLLLADKIQVRTGIYSSLSHFEPLESPPASGILFSRYLVNSKENFNHFIEQYPDFKTRTTIFPNAAPPTFLCSFREVLDEEIKAIAIISNHPPTELSDLAMLLRQRGIAVDLIGLQGITTRVTPELLSRYSAVLTIGKTVQYCLATGTPVFCYDHFGGPGWITLERINAAAEKNFSGRCTPRRRVGAELLNEVIDGFSLALSQRSSLCDLARRQFDLVNNLVEVLREASKNELIVTASPTDKAALRQIADLYCNLRTVIHNAHHVIADREKEKAHLAQRVSSIESDIESLSATLAERDRDIDGLKHSLLDRTSRLHAIENSRIWKMTSPLRSVAQELVAQRDRIRVRIGWAHFLLQRSSTVIRHQGLRVFMERAVRYINGWGRRKLAKLRQPKARRIGELAGDVSPSKVLVSFVIPIYDRTDVLRAAIQSALDQSVKDIEVILVTDGSPKETLVVVNEFSNDSRVKIFNYPCSSGNAVRGRNKGIREAQGRYIAFLDSDDIAPPDRLERSLPLLESGKADVVYGAWQAIVDGSRKIPGIADGQVVLSPDADLEMLLETCVPCQSTVIVRKSMFESAGLLKPTMQYREDHELWARLAYYGATFRSVDHVLAKLRLHQGNNELNFKDMDSAWLAEVHSEYTKLGPRPKKIAFILPGVGISGGIAVVFKHAALLMAAGHDAFVINVGDVGDGSWFSGNPVPIVHISDPRGYVFEGIDLLIATGWSTAEWLQRFYASRKLYFVQSDERRFFDDPSLKQRIHETYLIQCEYLTEALWIKEMLRTEFGHNAAYVPNGLDPKLFFPDIPLEPKNPKKPRVLIEGPIVIPFKGMADSYAAIEGLDCEIWIVSSAGKPPKSWRYDRFFEGVPFGEMRKIYSSCDVFLKMSRIEGFFGPPMEAMACGCAVVVGKVTGYDEYIVHEENALVVEQGDVDGARAAVKRLIDAPQLLAHLINGGHRTVTNWTWERSQEAMMSVVAGCPNHDIVGQQINRGEMILSQL